MICFGEILWDCLPSGRVLGGAQLNMSVQMHNLGLMPTLVSAVGQDDLGDEMLEEIIAIGLKTDSISQIEKYPTSRVNITLDQEGRASYDIEMPVAWDAIPIEEKHLKIAKERGVVYGTMAQRMKEDTYRNLDQLIEHSTLNFFDANFRLPFTTKELVIKYLPSADILKINSEELPVLMDWIGIKTNTKDGLKTIAMNYNINQIILTKGDKGSMILSNKRIYEHPGFEVDVVDTVGCGDAFTAGVVYGMEKHLGVDKTIEFASAVSAVVASKKGGCCSVTTEEVNTLIKGQNK